MQDIKRILLFLDPKKPCQSAVDRAMQFVQAFDAKLDIVSVFYNRSLVSDHVLDDDKGVNRAQNSYVEAHKHDIDKIIQPIVDAGIDHQVHGYWDKRDAKALVDIASTLQSDLVIKTTHHHSLLKRIFLTHNDWFLVQNLDAPLLLAKEDHESNNKTITVAIDPTSDQQPSQLNGILINTAKKMASKLQGTVKYFHCYDPVPSNLMLDADFAASSELANTIMEKHDESFKAFINEHQLTEDECDLVQGDITLSLPQYMEEHQSELLIMGAVERSAIDRVLIGSTAERILEVVNADILILKG